MEDELLEMFRSLPEDQKQLYLDYLRRIQPEEGPEE